MRALSSLVVIAALISMTGCSHIDRSLATGETLNAAGEIFVATAERMESLAEEGKITSDQYGAWKDFAKKFQSVYVLGNKMWKIAVITEDAVLEGKVIDTVVTMLPDLIKFAEAVGVAVEALKQ